MKKTFLISIMGFLTMLFVGCGAHGPMEVGTGPIDTPVFKPVILDTLKDGSKDIIFKEKYVGIYENKELKDFGSFIITDKGAYFIDWDTSSFVYNVRYQIKLHDIKRVTSDIVIRSFLPDSDILVIEDKRSQKVGFSIEGKFTVKDILNSFIDRSKSSN